MAAATTASKSLFSLKFGGFLTSLFVCDPAKRIFTAAPPKRKSHAKENLVTMDSLQMLGKLGC